MAEMRAIGFDMRGQQTFGPCQFAKFAAQLLNDGFTFVACGSDISLLTKGAAGLLAGVKDGLE